MRWAWPWRRHNNGKAEAQATEALAEQQRKLRETERLGDELRRAAQSVERRSNAFIADVEAAWMRRQR